VTTPLSSNLTLVNIFNADLSILLHFISKSFSLNSRSRGFIPSQTLQGNAFAPE
jgi:hypothetical protein